MMRVADRHEVFCGPLLRLPSRRRRTQFSRQPRFLHACYGFFERHRLIGRLHVTRQDLDIFSSNLFPGLCPFRLSMRSFFLRYWTLLLLTVGFVLLFLVLLEMWAEVWFSGNASSSLETIFMSTTNDLSGSIMRSIFSCAMTRFEGSLLLICFCDSTSVRQI